MSKEIARVQQSVIECDGFNDFTNEIEGEEESVNVSAHVIQGTRIKYKDPRWLIGTSDVTGKLLTVLGQRNVATKWGFSGLHRAVAGQRLWRGPEQDAGQYVVGILHRFGLPGAVLGELPRRLNLRAATCQCCAALG
jgi:hypothetical protein